MARVQIGVDSPETYTRLAGTGAGSAAGALPQPRGIERDARRSDERLADAGSSIANPNVAMWP